MTVRAANARICRGQGRAPQAWPETWPWPAIKDMIAMINPSPDFVRWGDRVLTRLKRKLTRLPELAPPWLYFGASALQWIDNSGATMTGGAISSHDPRQRPPSVRADRISAVLP